MKLFNTQRMTFLKNKQFRKYIVYAFGEIILVIIGILIALGISNWNKTKELKTANIELQEKVLNQLDLDIGYVENFQKTLDTLNQIYFKVLDRDYDKTKVNDDGLLSTVLFEVNALALDLHVNNLVDNSVLDDSKASQELIEINSMYKLQSKSIKDIEDIIFSKMRTNLEELERTQDWYTELITDFKCGNDCINYLLHNEDHKSRIASLRFLYVHGYGDILNGFLHDLKLSREALHSAIDNG